MGHGGGACALWFQSPVVANKTLFNAKKAQTCRHISTKLLGFFVILLLKHAACFLFSAFPIMPHLWFLHNIFHCAIMFPYGTLTNISPLLQPHFHTHHLRCSLFWCAYVSMALHLSWFLAIFSLRPSLLSLCLSLFCCRGIWMLQHVLDSGSVKRVSTHCNMYVWSACAKKCNSACFGSGGLKAR